MKKLLGSLTFLLIVGCGVDESFKDVISNEDIGYRISTADNIIGAEANNARKFMSDRGFSSEEVGYEISTADDVAGEQANHSRKHLSDRGFSSEEIGGDLGKVDNGFGEMANSGRKYMSDHGFSSEEVGYEVGTVDNMTGAEANRARKNMSDKGFSSEEVIYEVSTADNIIGSEANNARKYVYDRGIEEMRYGDQDSTSAIENNSSSIESNKAYQDGVNEELSSEIASNSARIDNLSNLLNILQIELADLTNEYLASVELFGSDISDLSDDIADLQGQIDNLVGNLEALTVADINGLRAELEYIESSIAAIDPSEFCSVEKDDAVATVTCGEASVSIVDGAGNIKIKELCAQGGEILLRLPGKKYVAFFTQPAYQDNGNGYDNREYLTVLDRNVQYRTTDGENCYFYIKDNGALMNGMLPQ